MMCFNLPQRMINIAKLACVISVVSVAFSSCLQKDVYDPANSGDKEEVTLDNYFDFATTKNIQLNIDYGKECPRAYFEVYAENPLSYVAEGGQIIKKAGCHTLQPDLQIYKDVISNRLLSRQQFQKFIFILRILVCRLCIKLKLSVRMSAQK